MIYLSDSDAQAIIRIAKSLKAIKSDSLREINAARQLQIIKRKLEKKLQ